MKRYPDRERKYGWCAAILEAMLHGCEGERGYIDPEELRKELRDTPKRLAGLHAQVMGASLPSRLGNPLKGSLEILLFGVIDQFEEGEFLAPDPLGDNFERQRAAMEAAIKRMDEGSEKEKSELIGTKIAALRELEGMTQSQLAERCGKAQSNINRWELGKVAISIDNLEAVADALCVPAAFFL